MATQACSFIIHHGQHIVDLENKRNSVEHRTVAADVPLGPSLDPDPAHLGDGLHKGLVKRASASSPRVDGGPGPRVGVEQLVGREQAHPALQVPVVLVVEGPRRHHVHGHRDPRVHVRRAPGSELGRKARVQGRVLCRPADPAREGVAVRQAHRVARYMHAITEKYI
jgi:hypothetical protein